MRLPISAARAKRLFGALGLLFATSACDQSGLTKSVDAPVIEERARNEMQPISPRAAAPRSARYSRTVKWTSKDSAGKLRAHSRSVTHETGIRTLNTRTNRLSAEVARVQQIDGRRRLVDELRAFGLSVPATREELSAKDRTPWVRRQLLPVGADTMEILVSGRGALPSDTIRYYKKGVLQGVVVEEWSAGPRAWELKRRVMTSADGTFEDHTDVTFTGTEAASLSGNVSWLNLEPVNAPPLPFRLQPTSAVLQAPCDSCKPLRDEKNNARILMIGAVAAASVICIVHPFLPDCTAAVTAAALAINSFNARSQEYEACRSNPPPCRIGCAPQGAAVIRDEGSVVSVNGDLFDCPPGGGGNGSGGGNGGGSTTCWWLVYYDYDTGEVLGTEFLGCDIRPANRSLPMKRLRRFHYQSA
jgi:hypothetical protein